MRKKLFLLSLAIVCLVTFSSAAFAWFTKQYNPSIDDLTFNVATQEHIMISTTGGVNTFHDKLSFSEFVDKELTLTPLDGVVNENSISIQSGGVEQAINEKYIKIPLYFYASDDMNVYLAGSTSGKVVDAIEVNSSVIDTTRINKIINSIRIGFVSYDTRETPTSNGIVTSYDPLNTNVYSVNAKTNESYVGNVKPYETFNNIGHTEGIENDVVLFTAKAKKIHKLDVYIWLEGKDIDCIENIPSSLVKINLRFLGVTIEGAGE
jgi:hypothetical protein